MGDGSLPEIFGYNIHIDDSLASDDLFSILEALETTPELPPLTPIDSTPKVSELDDTGRLVSQNSVSSSTTGKDSENEHEASPAPTCKKRKLPGSAMYSSDEVEVLGSDGQQKSTAHVAVERNRRKQMNEHLSVLRSLMPCFYVKRGDQASIIGGVVDYIKEMHQVLQSLEAKKQRKLYSEILSPRISIISSSPKSSPILSPRKPPLGPRILSLPTSPKTPQQTSPYRPMVQKTDFLSAQSMSGITTSYGHQPSCSSSSPSLLENTIELVANSKSPIADIEVKFSGPNVILKTISARIPGQSTKIIAALEARSLDILHMSINAIGSTMINSFTIKIGIDCKLSAEELAHGIQQTFC